jgi:hypothetical protein
VSQLVLIPIIPWLSTVASEAIQREMARNWPFSQDLANIRAPATIYENGLEIGLNAT